MDRPDLQATNVQQNAPTLSGYQASVLDLTAAIYGTVRLNSVSSMYSMYPCVYIAISCERTGPYCQYFQQWRSTMLAAVIEQRFCFNGGMPKQFLWKHCHVGLLPVSK